MESENSGGRENFLAPDVPRWEPDPARPVIQLKGVTKRRGHDRA